MSSSPAVEVLRWFVVVTLLTNGLISTGHLLPIGDYVPLAVGGLFLWTAVHEAQRQQDGLARYGLELGGLLVPPSETPSGAIGVARDLLLAIVRALRAGVRELGAALVLALAVFPLFAFGFFIFHAPTRPFALQLPDDPASYLLTQLIVVAIPEEALFRGYFQGRLGDAFVRRVRVLGANFSPAALGLQALLFALIHFAVDLNPARLAVFFPALLFGWLRALRGGIGAPAAFHALCNLLSDVLARSWL